MALVKAELFPQVIIPNFSQPSWWDPFTGIINLDNNLVHLHWEIGYFSHLQYCPDMIFSECQCCSMHAGLPITYMSMLRSVDEGFNPFINAWVEQQYVRELLMCPCHPGLSVSKSAWYMTHCPLENHLTTTDQCMLKLIGKTTMLAGSSAACINDLHCGYFTTALMSDTILPLSSGLNIFPAVCFFYVVE